MTKKDKNGDTQFELSVIKKDNKHGHDSWGWGNLDKIILFTSDGTNLLGYPCEEEVVYMKYVASLLCKALNNGTNYDWVKREHTDFLIKEK
jgi:hypothetical protein